MIRCAGAALLLAAACAPLQHRDLVRTADPAARGYDERDFPRVQRIADGVYTYEQLRSAGTERFTTVSMFVVTQDGVLVADGQGSVAETRRLIDTIRGITTAPITHVVVASDHGDHTAGNAAFPSAALFLVHPTSYAALDRGTQILNRSTDSTRFNLVRERHVVRLGGREIHVLFLGRAHTGGDLVVHLPRERVVFMSEAYLNRVFPAMRSAYPAEWVTMIDRARALDARVYVPGHGFVDPPTVLREELDTYQRALRRVITEATRLHAAGRTVERAIAEARFADLESWTLHASQAPIAIRRIYAELNGELR